MNQTGRARASTLFHIGGAGSQVGGGPGTGKLWPCVSLSTLKQMPGAEEPEGSHGSWHRVFWFFAHLLFLFLFAAPPQLGGTSSAFHLSHAAWSSFAFSGLSVNRLCDSPIS